MQSNEEFYRELPFLPVTQLSHMPRPHRWMNFPHIHSDEYELSLILSGHGSLYLPGTERRLSPGDITLVSPGTAHYFVSAPEEDLEYYVLHVFQDSPDNPSVSRMQALGCRCVRSQYAKNLESLLRNAGELARQNGCIIDRSIQLICLAVWELSMQDLERSDQEILLTAPEYALDILRYLQENIYRKVTLEDLAEHFHLSASHISRVFSRTYHISPINYLIVSRMARARTYILKEQLPPAEIAKRLAYSDTWQFVNAFTKFFGCRPENYYEYARQTEE